MKGASTWCAVLGASLLLGACQGQEITVFELPSQGGSGGTGATTSAGNDGMAGDDTAVAGGPAVGGSSGSAGSFSTNWGGTGPDGGGGGGRPSGGAFGGPEPTASTCHDDGDCPLGLLCDINGCQATTGNCVPWPAVCLSGPSPVCGCDGVTYWSDCIRLHSRVRRDVGDQCRTTARTCDVGADCMTQDAICSHLQPPGPMCGRGVGTCWVLPSLCDPSVDGRRWRECRSPDGGFPSPCVDTCNAIASEHAYAEVHRGDICP